MKTTNHAAEVHSIQKHYQGKLFSFVSEDVTLPNGSRAEMAVVRHPGSTAVVPLLDDNTDGRITDALTVLSLQKAWFYLFGMPKMR